MMLRQHYITICLALGFIACSSTDDKVFSDDSNYEDKPVSLIKSGADGASLEQTKEEVKEAARSADQDLTIVLLQPFVLSLPVAGPNQG